MQKRVRVPADGDALKLPSLAAALGELSDEEPYINAQWKNGQNEITISTTGRIQLEAIVPVATSMELPTRLAVLSSGRAVLNQSFYGYRECRDGLEHINPRRGVNPLDRPKWILWARGAFQTE